MFLKTNTPYYCKIDLAFESGIIPKFYEDGSTCDFDWIDFRDQNYQKYINNHDIDTQTINFEISVNDQVIFNRCPDLQQHVIDNNHVIDQVNHQHNKITIKSTGFTDTHMPLVDLNCSTRYAIKLTHFKIDNHDVTAIFDKFATFQAGTNSSTGGLVFSDNCVCTFEFTTPIYQWFFVHRKLITGSSIYD